MTVKREAENILLSNMCPDCEKRLYMKEERVPQQRRYIPPKWHRALFKEILGVNPLGYYRLHRCEVCSKKLAVFDNNKGILRDDVVVLYACTLLSEPLDMEACAKQVSCYNCPAKKGELYVPKK